MSEKSASKIEQRKRQGFVAHCKAAGIPDARIRTALPDYVAQDARRTAKRVATYEAITGKKVS